MSESLFVKHLPCPSCGSKDNRGVWSDGHEYCFGCHDGTSSTIRTRLLGSLLTHTDNSHRQLLLPYDTGTTLVARASKYINGFLTPEEIHHPRIPWPTATQLLIFPFFKESELVGWIGRNFGETGAKYQIHGMKKEFSTVYGEGDVVVFTEDLISAVVVSRVTAARPLFGTSLPPNYVQGSKSYRLWLDKDKRIEAMKQCNHYKQYGIDIRPIFTEKDPKEYTNEQIKEFLCLPT